MVGAEIVLWGGGGFGDGVRGGDGILVAGQLLQPSFARSTDCEVYSDDDPLEIASMIICQKRMSYLLVDSN